MSRRSYCHLHGAAMALAIALVPSGAVAQDVDPDTTIVIEGTIDVDGKEVREQSREITQRRLATDDPYARFQRPICPGVWGLSPQNAQPVIDRIYDNAERAGMAVDRKEGCGANVWAIFVDDPTATFEELRKENGPLVRLLSRYERNQVKKQQGPVRAWNLTSTRDENGTPVLTGHELAAELQSALTNGTPPPYVPTSKMSRLHSPIRRDIEMSVVLIARSAIAGLDAYSIADYVTMRAFARTEEPDDVNYDTVLTLFRPGSVTQRLSAFDRAYLESLYRTDPHRPARGAMPGVERKMESELASEE